MSFLAVVAVAVRFCNEATQCGLFVAVFVVAVAVIVDVAVAVSRGVFGLHSNWLVVVVVVVAVVVCLFVCLFVVVVVVAAVVTAVVVCSPCGRVCRCC